MKKLLYLILICLSTMLFLSCKKEDPKACNCGLIVNDGVDGSCYWLEIKNDCSSNIKRFCFDQNTWMNNPVGDSFCVTNIKQW